MALRIEDYALIGDCKTAALVGAAPSRLCRDRFRRSPQDGDIAPAPSSSKPNSKPKPALPSLSISCLRQTAPILCGS